MRAVFKVDRRGCRAVVTKDSDVVWGPGGFVQAERERDDLERQARRKLRNCMTCGGEFMSQGAHHRMCNRCRSTVASDAGCYSFAPRSSRRSPAK